MSVFRCPVLSGRNKKTASVSQPLHTDKSRRVGEDTTAESPAIVPEKCSGGKPIPHTGAASDDDRSMEIRGKGRSARCAVIQSADGALYDSDCCRIGRPVSCGYFFARCIRMHRRRPVTASHKRAEAVHTVSIRRNDLRGRCIRMPRAYHTGRCPHAHKRTEYTFAIIPEAYGRYTAQLKIFCK